MKAIEANEILAIITLKRNAVAGGVPIFIAESPEEQEKTSLYLAKMLNGMVHDLENGVYVVVSH